MKLRYLKVLCVILFLTVFLTGCDSADYKKAMSLFEQGSYSEAYEIFEELGDYSDSPEMLRKCAYYLALGYMESGDYQQARSYFLLADGWEDSQVLLVKTSGMILKQYLMSSNALSHESSDRNYKVHLGWSEKESAIFLRYESTYSAGGQENKIIEVRFYMTPGETEVFVECTYHYNRSSGSSYVNVWEFADATLNFTSYCYGDEPEWENHEFNGMYQSRYEFRNMKYNDHEEYGILLKETYKYLERMINGLETLLAEYEIGITIEDLGFTSLG